MSKRSKYNVDESKKAKKNRTVDGIKFASDLEMRFYLYLLEQKDILYIKLQPEYIIQDPCVYKGKKILKIIYTSDFEVIYKNGQVVIYEVKGFETKEFKIKKKMFYFRYPDLNLKIVSYSGIDGGWIELDQIMRNRKSRKKEKGKIKKTSRVSKKIK